MPLRVVHPVRLVIDHTEASNEALLRDGLRAGLARAVTASVERVLSAQPEGSGVRVIPAKVSWAPSAAPALGRTARDRIAGWIQEEVDAVLADCGVTDGITGDAAGLGGGLSGEPADEARIHRALRRYVVPSYRGDETEAVRLELGPVDVTSESIVPGRAWVPIDEHSLASFAASYRAEIARRHYSAPSGRLLGIIFRGRRSGLVHIGAVDHDAGEYEGAFPLGNLVEPYVTSAGEIGFRPADLGADSDYWLSWEGTVGEARSVITRFQGESLAALLRDEVKPGPLQLSKDYQAAVSERVNSVIEQQVAEHQTDGTTCFARLDVDGSAFLLAMMPPFPDWVRPGLSIPVIALTREAPQTEGEGAGPGGGRRKDRVGQDQSGKDQSGPDTTATDGGTGPPDVGLLGAVSDVISLVEAGDESAAVPATRATLFPSPSWSLFTLSQDCSAYEGEPSLNDLGDAAAALREQMAEIAGRLAMDSCDHVAAFLIDCGTFIGARASAVADAGDPTAGRSEAPPAGIRGNLGDLHFTPVASVSVLLLRQLAGTVPLISRLSRDYQKVLSARAGLISGMWHGQYLSWKSRYQSDFGSSMTGGIARLFSMTCSVLFRQLLRSSAAVIENARQNLDQTAQVFSERVLPMLVDVAEYTEWKDKLEDTERAHLWARLAADTEAAEPVVPEFAELPPSPATARGTRGAGDAARAKWSAAAAGTVAALSGTRPPAASSSTRSDRAGQIVHTPGGYRVLDLNGRPRDKEQVEQLIILARGSAESVDPLVKHIDDLPGTVRRMRDELDGVRRELDTILSRMALSNAMITAEAAGDLDYGFQATTAIQEDPGHGTIYGGNYALGGIHALAHHELGEFVAGNHLYAAGVDALMENELGRRSLLGFVELVGLVLVSVLCPPAGIVLGVELALSHLAEAYERKAVYEALVDPDLVLSRAEVELGLFAAWLGVALSLLPVLGKVAGMLGRALESEAGAAARLAAAEEAAALAAVRTAEKDLLTEFVVQLATNEALGRVLGVALTPVFAHLRHELETTASPGGMDRALALVIARRRAARQGG
jgi:hypothetical protein